VNSLMFLKVTGSSEGFATRLTYIGFSPLWILLCFWR
jgi:hypothetical protein